MCLGWRLSLANKKLQSNSGILETVLPNNDTEIIIKGSDFDASDQDFIEALQKNRTHSENSKMMTAAKFLSSLKLKKYRRTHRQNGFLTKHQSRDIHSQQNYKSIPILTKPNPSLSTSHSQIDDILNRHKFNQNMGPDFKSNKQKKETGFDPPIASDKKEASNSESPLRIVDSWFQHLQPGDVVLLFHIILMNSGKDTLKILTTHNCCFTMPKLEQEEEGNGKLPEEEKAVNCQSMALVGQREYTLLPQESRNLTLLFASTQLLIYQYQRKGYCEIEFISEGVSDTILASTTINFDTAMGRLHEKEENDKKNPNKHLRTTHLETKDGLYTGMLCEDRKCIPVDCIQEFGGEANRFSIYRGKCMSTPYCSPSGFLFYDNRWNMCRNITDLRLDPIFDLDEVPEMVKKGKSPLASGIKKLVPGKDLKTLRHMECDQLQNVAERTWGKAFLCQNLPLICERCSIN